MISITYQSDREARGIPDPTVGTQLFSEISVYL